MPIVDVPPQEAQFDEFGRPLHPIAAAIHNASTMMDNAPVANIPGYSPTNIPIPGDSNIRPNPLDQAPVVQITQPNIQPPPFIPGPAKPLIDTSPRAVVPAKSTQSDIGYSNLTAPNYQDYLPSRGQRIMAAIAGGFTGAANPAVGIQVAKDIRDRNYNIAKEQYTNQLDKSNRQREVEKNIYEQGKQAETAGLEFGRIQATASHNAEADAAKEETNRIRAKTEEDARTNAETRKKNEESLERARKWRESNANELQSIINMPLDTPENIAKHTEALKLHSEKARMSPEEYADRQQKLIDLKAKPENLVKEAETSAATTGARIGATKKATEAPTDVDQTNIDALVKRTKEDPDSYPDLLEQAIKLKIGSQFAAATANLDVGKKIPPTQLTARNNAITALLHADSVEKLINSPGVAGHLGPIAGRITEAGQVIGKSITGTPEEEELTTALAGMQRYLVTFEASSTSGTRPSWQLIRYLQGTSPGMRMDPKMLQGALDSVRLSAHNRLKAIYQKSDKGLPVEVEKPKLKIEWSPKKD